MPVSSSSNSHLVFLRRYLHDQIPKIGFLAAVAVTRTGMQLAMPPLIGRFIDSAENNAPLTLLINLAMLVVGVAIGEQFLRLVTTWFNEKIAWIATNRLRHDLFVHTIGLDMGFHNQHSTGTMVERIDGDVNELAQFFSSMIITIFDNGLLLVGILIYFLIQTWQLGLIYVAFCIAAVFLMRSIRSLAMRFFGAVRETKGELMGMFEEFIGGSEDLRSRGAGEYAQHRLHYKLRDLYRVHLQAQIRGSFMFNSVQLAFLGAAIIILIYGASLFTSGAITIGTLFLYYLYIEMLERPLSGISRQLEYFQRATASLQRVEEVLMTEPKIVDGSGVDWPTGACDLAFEQVTFGYSDEQMVLRDVTFHLAAGRSLGILGRTGSGKTTLSRLLFRFYDPNSGSITLGGEPIAAATVSQLRQRIALVTQEVQLFDASVRDNVTLFDHSVEDDRVIALLHDLGLGGWLDNLDAGLDTLLNSSNSGLSAGQAQLLSFARAFLQHPSLVILDEASSRLDPITERLIDTATTRLRANCTMVVIAHRLETIAAVDELIILSDGQIVEQGSYEQLRDDPGSAFSAMLEAGQVGVIS